MVGPGDKTSFVNTSDLVPAGQLASVNCTVQPSIEQLVSSLCYFLFICLVLLETEITTVLQCLLLHNYSVADIASYNQPLLAKPIS